MNSSAARGASRVSTGSRVQSSFSLTAASGNPIWSPGMSWTLESSAYNEKRIARQVKWAGCVSVIVCARSTAWGRAASRAATSAPVRVGSVIPVQAVFRVERGLCQAINRMSFGDYQKMRAPLENSRVYVNTFVLMASRPNHSVGPIPTPAAGFDSWLRNDRDSPLGVRETALVGSRARPAPVLCESPSSPSRSRCCS
jgi:hypothetical protein